MVSEGTKSSSAHLDASTLDGHRVPALLLDDFTLHQLLEVLRDGFISFLSTQTIVCLG